MIQPAQQAGRIQPFYFGKGERVFGVVDQPAPDKARSCAVVVCQPLGHEWVRCQRGCRQLAFRLAMAGFPVLRFDLSGNGDSLGESQQASFEDWMDDTAAAIAYMRARAERVCVVGLRLGGSLAWRASAGRSDVERMVLWQPVIDGRAYLEEIRSQHAAHEEKHGWQAGESGRAAGLVAASEVLGFALSDAASAAIARLELEAASPAQPGKVLLLCNAASEDQRAFGALVERAVAVDVRLVDEPAAWLAEPYELIMPLASIDAIVSWISSETQGQR